MKRILSTFISFILIVPFLGAQSTPFVDTSRPPKHIPEVGVHFGVGVSTITQNYLDQIENCSDFFLTPGCQTVFGASVELPIRQFFSIGTGADFTISNYNWSMSAINGHEGTLYTLYSRNTYRAIEIPLYMNFRFNLGSKVKWNNQLGAYISHGISGKSKYRAYVSSTNDIGQSQVSTSNYERDYYKDTNPVINTNYRSNYGLHIATGLMYNEHWTLNCVLRVGFRNMARNTGVLDITQHEIACSFRLGYCF